MTARENVRPTVSFDDLSALSQSMFWPLYNRAAEARRSDARLTDPHAIRIVQSIDRDLAAIFGRPNAAHAMRALAFDRLLQAWLSTHPDGQIVALGDGLETQCYRVDNGRMQWLSIDLPEALAVRQQFIPPTDRWRHVVSSALDARWMDAVDRDRPIFIIACGLLMYFHPSDVSTLITAIAERFPSADIAFDTVPHWVVRKTQQGWQKTSHFRVPEMAWGVDRDELRQLEGWHRHLTNLQETPYTGRGLKLGLLLPLLLRLPGLRNKVPTVAHLQGLPASGSSETARARTTGRRRADGTP